MKLILNNAVALAKAPLVYVVIVNFNGMRWLAECLSSLFATRYDNFEVVLVDNHSADDSVAFVRAHFPQAHVIVNADNLGFCEGNNVGIQAALSSGAQYVVLLNNDTKLTENWLTELIQVGEQMPTVAVLGAVQLSYNGTKFNSWTTTAARAHLTELGSPETARAWIPMRWVEGSCFAIKRHVLEEVGWLDPIYFMYYEEIDYCRRVQAHGYQVALVPRSRIHHFRGGTAKLDEAARRQRERLYDRSHLIYHATDLRHSLAFNFGRYWLTVVYKFLEQIRRRRLYRLRDIVSLQPEIFSSTKRLLQKWQIDRRRLRAAPALLAPAEAAVGAAK